MITWIKCGVLLAIGSCRLIEAFAPFNWMWVWDGLVEREWRGQRERERKRGRRREGKGVGEGEEERSFTENPPMSYNFRAVIKDFLNKL